MGNDLAVVMKVGDNAIVAVEEGSNVAAAVELVNDIPMAVDVGAEASSSDMMEVGLIEVEK